MNRRPSMLQRATSAALLVAVELVSSRGSDSLRVPSSFGVGQSVVRCKEVNCFANLPIALGARRRRSSLFVGAHGRSAGILSCRGSNAACSNPFALSPIVHRPQGNNELKGGGTWGGYEARSRIQAK